MNNRQEKKKKRFFIQEKKLEGHKRSHALSLTVS